MTYAVAALLGVAWVFLSFPLSVTSGNITHIRNGREPNAGAAVFPDILFVPLLWVGAAWLLELIQAGLGLWGTGGAFLLFLVYWWVTLRRLRGELRLLKHAKQQEGGS